jgi:hypothetical protein
MYKRFLLVCWLFCIKQIAFAIHDNHLYSGFGDYVVDSSGDCLHTQSYVMDGNDADADSCPNDMSNQTKMYTSHGMVDITKNQVFTESDTHKMTAVNASDVTSNSDNTDVESSGN